MVIYCFTILILQYDMLSNRNSYFFSWRFIWNKLNWLMNKHIMKQLLNWWAQRAHYYNEVIYVSILILTACVILFVFSASRKKNRCPSFNRARFLVPGKFVQRLKCNPYSNRGVNHYMINIFRYHLVCYDWAYIGWLTFPLFCYTSGWTFEEFDKLIRQARSCLKNSFLWLHNTSFFTEVLGKKYFFIWCQKVHVLLQAFSDVVSVNLSKAIDSGTSPSSKQKHNRGFAFVQFASHAVSHYKCVLTYVWNFLIVLLCFFGSILCLTFFCYL